MNNRRLKRLENAVKCYDWSEAFDHCREMNHPVDVCIEDGVGIEYAHVFPSGHAEIFYEEFK